MPSHVPVASESEPNAGTMKRAALSGSLRRFRWVERAPCSHSACERSACGAGLEPGALAEAAELAEEAEGAAVPMSEVAADGAADEEKRDWKAGPIDRSRPMMLRVEEEPPAGKKTELAAEAAEAAEDRLPRGGAPGIDHGERPFLRA